MVLFCFFPPSKPVRIVARRSTRDVQRLHQEDKSRRRRRESNGHPIEKLNSRMLRQRRHSKHLLHHSVPASPVRRRIVHRSDAPIGVEFLATALCARRKKDRSSELAGDRLRSVAENPKWRRRPRLFQSRQWSGTAFQFEAIVVDFFTRESVFGFQICLSRYLRSAT